METIFNIPKIKQHTKIKINKSSKKEIINNTIKHKTNKIKREILTINYIDKRIVQEFKRLANKNNYSQKSYFTYLINKELNNE